MNMHHVPKNGTVALYYFATNKRGEAKKIEGIQSESEDALKEQQNLGA